MGMTDWKTIELEVAVEEYKGIETVAYASRYLENRIPTDWYTSSVIQDVSVSEGESPSVTITVHALPIAEGVESSLDRLIEQDHEKLERVEVRPPAENV